MRGGALQGGFQRDAGHHQAQHAARRVRRHDPDDPAAVHHDDPIGQGGHLVELGGDDQHRGAGIALGDDALVDELDRSDVDAAGRL